MSEIDKRILQSGSKFLLSINERSLYLNQSSDYIFRLIYLRSFDPPLMVKVRSDSIIIIEDYDGPEFDKSVNVPNLPHEEADLVILYHKSRYKNEAYKDSLEKIYPKVLDSNYIQGLEKKVTEYSFKIHKSKKIKLRNTEEDYKQLTEAVKNSGIWKINLPNYINPPCVDGSTFIMESYKNNCYNYYFVACPHEGSIRNLFLKILGYSNLESEKIY